MKVAIIDADLIGRNKHRFPNLALMKVSAFYKDSGNDVVLKTDYTGLELFDSVFISKVFTDTPISENVLTLANVTYGGTGFYYDKAIPLPNEIEHHKPDYNLYDEWVNEQISKGKKKSEFEYYIDYSIGYTTRFCFRKCPYCVNRNFEKVELHSPIVEFLDTSRKYVCMLDDNLFGYPGWKEIINELRLINKPFQFKQGLDERLLTHEKAEMLSKCKYKGDFIFAFDNIEDKQIIEEKLTIWRQHCNKTTKLYVFTGFDVTGKYDEAFWKQDLINVFERVKILMKHNCLPYIMRFNRYVESPYKNTYINLASWCNQPNFFKKKSFRQMSEAEQQRTKLNPCASVRSIMQIEEIYPEIAKEYFDLRYDEVTL